MKVPHSSLVNYKPPNKNRLHSPVIYVMSPTQQAQHRTAESHSKTLRSSFSCRLPTHVQHSNGTASIFEKQLAPLRTGPSRVTRLAWATELRGVGEGLGSETRRLRGKMPQLSSYAAVCQQLRNPEQLLEHPRVATAQVNPEHPFVNKPAVCVTYLRRVSVRQNT